MLFGMRIMRCPTVLGAAVLALAIGGRRCVRHGRYYLSAATLLQSLRAAGFTVGLDGTGTRLMAGPAGDLTDQYPVNTYGGAAGAALELTCSGRAPTRRDRPHSRSRGSNRSSPMRDTAERSFSS